MAKRMGKKISEKRTKNGGKKIKLRQGAKTATKGKRTIIDQKIAIKTGKELQIIETNAENKKTGYKL